MKDKSLIFFFISVITILKGQTGLNYEFNQYYLESSPFFMDLTLDQNFKDRAQKKIGCIVKKTYPLKGPSAIDSLYIKNPKKAVANHLGHIPTIQYLYYNDFGAIIKSIMIPYYFKLDYSDSVKVNENKKVIIDSTNEYYKITRFYDKSPCKQQEVYKNGLLVEEGNIGFCPGTLRANGKDTIYSDLWSNKFKYDSIGRKNYAEYSRVSIWDNLATITSCEFYRYEPNKIIITRYTNCKDKETVFENVIHENKQGKIFKSEFFDRTLGNYTAFLCDFDKYGNLTEVYMVYTKKGRKELLYKFLNHYKNGKLEMIEYTNSYGNKTILLDESGRPIEIVNNAGDYVNTFEYH